MQLFLRRKTHTHTHLEAAKPNGHLRHSGGVRHAHALQPARSETGGQVLRVWCGQWVGVGGKAGDGLLLRCQQQDVQLAAGDATLEQAQNKM